MILPLRRKTNILILVVVLICTVIVLRISRKDTRQTPNLDIEQAQSLAAELKSARTLPALPGPHPTANHFRVREFKQANQSSSLQEPLQEGAQIELVYMAKETRRPITAGEVSIRQENSDFPIFGTAIGEDGRNFLEMYPGKYKIRVDSPGYGRQDESIEVLSMMDRIRKIIELSRTIVVKGIVKNARGHPQEGTEVDVFQEGFRVSQKTGTTGEFDVRLRIQPILKIIAHLPPHPIAELGPIFWDETNIPYLQITLPKEADTAWLKGKVLDEQGKPVKNAAVEVTTNASYAISDKSFLWMEPWLRILQTRSDSDGFFVFQLPRPCKAWLAVFAEDFEVHREILQVSSDAELKISLMRHPQFEVKVHDLEGKEILGITVMGLSPVGREVVHEASVSGRYYANEYPFTIFGRGVLNDLGFTKGEWIDKPRDEIVLELGQCVVQGKVIDETGRPVKAFNVYVTYKNDKIYGSYQLFCADFPTKFYSEYGLFAMKHLVPGSATFTVTANSAYGESEPWSQDLVVSEGRPTFFQIVLNKRF